MRSSEHAAHRPLMHSVHVALLAQGLALCVIHVIHACALVVGLLSVLFLVSLSFYFLSLFLFQLYLMSTSAPDETSVPNPLCDSSLGSVVTSDYVTPLTGEGENNPRRVNPRERGLWPTLARPALATTLFGHAVTNFGHDLLWPRFGQGPRSPGLPSTGQPSADHPRTALRRTVLRPKFRAFFSFSPFSFFSLSGDFLVSFFSRRPAGRGGFTGQPEGENKHI